MDHLKPFEQAARNYCAKANLDPDLPIPAPHPQGLQVSYTIPNWTLVAEDLLDLSMKLTAMKEAAAQPTVIVQ